MGVFTDIIDKRKSYYYGGFVREGKNKGKHKFTVGNKNKRTKYFTDYEKGKKWEAGERKIKYDLDKPKGKKFPKSELNKAAQFFFKKDYDKLDQKQKSKAYDRVRGNFKVTGQKKFKAKNLESPLSKTDQAKIKKEFPDAVFKQGQKYGFPYNSLKAGIVSSFVKRGFKRAFEGGKFKSLPKYAQQELINAFPDVKFDFQDRSKRKGSANVAGWSKYGVPFNHPRYQSIRAYFDDPKPFRYGFNLRTAGGWTIGQMDRAALHGDTRYEPILQKPGKPISKNNKVIGIVDKTGRTPKRYNAENILKTHPNRAEIIKYVDVANRSRTPLANYPTIAKLLPEGFDPEKIQLNDLLQFIAKDKRGINRAKRAIEIHHVEGVKNKATGNFQLLRRDLNMLANTIEQQISRGNLDRTAELDAKRIRVETGGVKYGGRARTAEGDFRALLKGVETELKDPKFKFNQFKKAIAKMSPNKTCAVGRRPKAEGGGVSGLDECFKEGMRALKEKNINKPHQVQGAKQLMNAGKKVGAGKFANVLTNLGIVGEVAFIAGDVGIRQAMGRPFYEAFLAATFREGKADTLRQERFGVDSEVIKANKIAEQIDSINAQIKSVEALMGEYYDEADMQALLNRKAELEKQLEPVGEYLGPTSSKNISSRIREAEGIDSDLAKSAFTKARLRDNELGIPNIADYGEIDAGVSKVRPKERSVLPNEKDATIDYLSTMYGDLAPVFYDSLSDAQRKNLSFYIPGREEQIYGFNPDKSLTLPKKNKRSYIPSPQEEEEREQLMSEVQGAKDGGLMNLTETTPPKRSLNKDSQGLASLPEYDR